MFDFEQHLVRQMTHSEKNFGPGQRTNGVIDHIRKETQEVLDGNGDVHEWIDLVILSLDGLTRQIRHDIEGIDLKSAASMATALLVMKQTKNENRVWPDWRTADPNKAIEHDRSNDVNDNMRP